MMTSKLWIINWRLITRLLQFLAIEIYKSINKLNPSFMWKTREKNFPHSLRRGISLSIQNVSYFTLKKLIINTVTCFFPS